MKGGFEHEGRGARGEGVGAYTHAECAAKVVEDDPGAGIARVVHGRGGVELRSTRKLLHYQARVDA